MRTYSAADWKRAQQAWLAGEFGPEWDDPRAAARARGFIFPPAGSPHDDWDDEHPSQRAIVYRAIEETPRLLGLCIGRSRSWAEVVKVLAVERDAWRSRLADDDEELRLARSRADRPRDAERLADIVRRLP